MIKKSILFIILYSLNTNFFFAQSNTVSNQHDILIGNIKKENFQEKQYKEWYNQEYNSYKLDKNSLNRIKTKFEDKEVLIYFGTWCSDSRREVPRFIKILDFLKVDYNNIKFTALDRKKQAPNYKLNIWDIVYVPTFIILKDGKEIGRIIETPTKSLEIDLFEILKQ